jgi:phenylpyruvate tautomerase PptA (4-oxalocrotonate tautomerase family)
MPMIDLTLPAGALQRSALTTLVEDLTTTALHWERVADNPATRAMAWVFVHELPRAAVNVGGKPAELPIYRVFLTVPQGLPGITGPLNEQRRNALVREVTELVLVAEGVTDIEAHVQRVWCMIREQSDGFWGATGRILRMTDWDALAQAGETAAGRGHLTFAE